MKSVLTIILLVSIVGCARPNRSADKTLISSGLGSGIGAGAGAIVGNQVGNLGQGAAVGAGVGLLSGLTTGIMFDSVERRMNEQYRALDVVKIQNDANSEQLARLQAKLDRAFTSDALGGIYQVYFDVDTTTLKAGSVANLEAITNSIKTSPYAYTVNVVGHTDDSGNPEYNDQLAEARARSVSAYLGTQGVAMDQIVVSSHGAKRPIASNNTEAGRQLNRRVDIFFSH